MNTALTCWSNNLQNFSVTLDILALCVCRRGGWPYGRVLTTVNGHGQRQVSAEGDWGSIASNALGWRSIQVYILMV